MGAEVKAELERLNEDWNRAWIEKDALSVEEMMAEDYVYIAPGGQVLDRATVVGIIRSTSYHLDWGRRTEVEIRELGPDTGMILSRWQGQGSFERRAFKDDHRCISVCVRRAGRWLITAEQANSIST